MYLQSRQSLVKPHNKSGFLFAVDRLDNSSLIFKLMAKKAGSYSGALV
jgi:hypothetical protein